MWYMHEGTAWWMAFGGIWMIFFWGGLVALIVWGISKITRNNSSGEKQRPLEIAKERYARGDISREEYEKIKKDL